MIVTLQLGHTLFRNLRYELLKSCAGLQNLRYELLKSGTGAFFGADATFEQLIPQVLKVSK